MVNNIDEAVVRMEQAVAAVDARRDRRAVLLYAHLLITYNVRDRIRSGWFFDGEWLSRLAGKFARLYFESLEAYDAGRPVVEGIQADGTCRCGGTVWQRRAALRLSVSSWATTGEDVERSLGAILRVASGTAR